MLSSMDLPRFIAGLGLFLYGMKLLEAALKTLSSESFRAFLRKSTANPWGSVAGGALTTMVLQSSSMVGLMMMAFVGAGMIPLSNAVGVVLGANIGTTITGWIVTTLGFKLKLDALAVPIMGLGALGAVVFGQRVRSRAWSECVWGLGLLLFGLDAMKTAMELAAAQADVTLLQGYPLLVYLLVGVIFTALIRSSSAAMMIILGALHTGSLDLPAAAALAVGADMGTTSTLLLGSIKGSAVKKQLAMSHVLFNLMTTVVAFLCLHPLVYVVQHVFQIEDPLYALVAFHTTFNCIGVLVFTPFVRPFAAWLEQHYVDPVSDIRLYINNVPAAMPDEAITAIGKEVQRVLLAALALNLRNLKLDPDQLEMPTEWRTMLREAFPKERLFEDCYDDIKKLEGKILEYAGQVQREPLSAAQVDGLHRFLSAARHGVYAAKSLKDVREDLVMLRHSEIASVAAYRQRLLAFEHVHWLVLLETVLGQADSEAVRLQLQSLLGQSRQFHLEVETGLFQTGLQSGLDALGASTLLNLNRECREALQAFARAVGFWCLAEQHGLE